MKFDWLCIGTNKKRLVAGVLLAAVCCFAPFGLVSPNYRETAVFKVLFVLLFIGSGLVSIRLSRKTARIVYPVLAVAASVVTACMSQLICAGTVHLPTAASLLLTSLCVFILYCAAYVITASTQWSIVIGSALIVLLSVANTLVVDFQGNSLTPTAILGFRTAMDVIGNYRIEFDVLTIRACILVLAVCFGVFSFGSEKVKLPAAWSLMRRASALAAALLLSFTAVRLTDKMIPVHWQAEGTKINGYILNFVLELSELIVSPPNGYSDASVKELESKYGITPPLAQCSLISL